MVKIMRKAGENVKIKTEQRPPCENLEAILTVVPKYSTITGCSYPVPKLRNDALNAGSVSAMS
jgi:hypothetical protein